MVLHKWAVVNKSAPPPAGLRPLAKYIPTHSKLRPVGYKTPYVIRPFIKDLYTSQMQHLENRGMYREELALERGRFPCLHKTFTIQTDGSLNEREFEFVVPPLMILFQDRLSVHRQQQLALSSIGKLKCEKSWETKFKTKESLNMMCNAVLFPYCVPKKMLMRPPMVNRLNIKVKATESKAED